MADRKRLDAYHFYESDWDSYDELHEVFEWEVPETFNVATYLCDRWATDRSKAALFHESTAGRTETYTFWQVQIAANRLANYLTDRGVERGDRVAMTGVQKPATLVTMVAAWKLGAIAVPVSAMYGVEGLAYRLADAAVSAFVVDETNLETFRAIERDLPTLETVLTMDCAPAVGTSTHEEFAFRDALSGNSREFETVATDPEEPATIVYTSGTTGKPKGVVHAHRVLLGHLPGFVAGHLNMALTERDVSWVLAEWSWIGVYPGVLCPLFYGRPVVGFARQSFDPERAFELIERYGVTYLIASPTAYRMMMQEPSVEQYDLRSVRAAPLGGEAPGESIERWITTHFDDPATNVVYGQTEVDILICESAALGVSRDGSIGVPMPGHEVRILDPETAEPTLPTGEGGEIGVRHVGDPVCFSEYWNRPETTAEKVKNGWLRTEDLGRVDEEGYVFFESRKDDVILSSGYRIGPEEVEESLATHDAVADAGVIGVPHETRGEIVKAYVQLAPGYQPSEDLSEALKQHVKDRLAKYEYPRDIEFIDELPTTTTEKVRRADLREREGLTE